MSAAATAAGYLYAAGKLPKSVQRRLDREHRISKLADVLARRHRVSYARGRELATQMIDKAEA